MHLHDDDARKRSFGLDAERYDATRHRYPDALVERVVAYAKLTAASRVLEVGSGTGIATLPFAERGLEIDCIELSEGMATVARAKLAAFPRVRVHTSSFERFEASARFDLVTCAQTWHWISPDVRYARARALLRPSGTLAVFANWDASLVDVITSIYKRHGLVESRGGAVPMAWCERDPPDIAASIADARASIERAGGYRDIEFHRYPWSRTFTAAEYVALLRTISDISTRSAEIRDPFLADVAAAIEAEGVVTRQYEAVVMLARS
ncbi:MAG TPA: class I SAM-dependent methyltransferase [Polyangiaceae bacterium]